MYKCLDPIREEILRDNRFRLSSRQAWLWVWISHSQGYINLSLETQIEVLKCTREILKESTRNLCRWGFFRYDKQGRRYWRCYLPDEDKHQFKVRIQQSSHLEANLRVAWSLTDLTYRNDGVPKTATKLAEELLMHPVTARSALIFVVKTGLFSRFGGHGGINPSRFSRPYDPQLNEYLLDTYGGHHGEK
jgi:hypothetical protein